MTSRELTISYREACRNYGYGFTLGAFMTTTVLAIVLEWTTVAQETAQVLFLGIAFIGCATFIAARYRPVWFYELLEGRYQEDEPDVEEVDESKTDRGFPRTRDEYEAIQVACLELHKEGYEKVRCEQITSRTQEVLKRRGFRSALSNSSIARYLTEDKFNRWAKAVTVSHERDPPGSGWWHIEITARGDSSVEEADG